MRHDNKPAPRRAALPAAMLAALLLAGCSSGNIGESWQCPLAKGGSCDSVAAADPAVPDAGGRTVLGEPLWQVRNEDRAGPTAARATTCATDCDAGFDPFAWLARLFGHDMVEGETRPAGGSVQASSGVAAQLPDSVPGADATAPAAAPPAEPATAALPAEQPSLQAEPAATEDSPGADDLRTGEVVARNLDRALRRRRRRLSRSVPRPRRSGAGRLEAEVIGRLLELFEGPEAPGPWTPPAMPAALPRPAALARLRRIERDLRQRRERRLRHRTAALRRDRRRDPGRARGHARRRRARALHHPGHPLGQPKVRGGKPGLGRAP